MRDLATYAPRDVTTIDAAAVRARFAPRAGRPSSGPARVRPTHTTTGSTSSSTMATNDPPPRALILHLLVRWVPATPRALGS